MNLYERWLRPCFFRLEPETAHELSLDLLRLGSLPPFPALLERFFRLEHPALETTVAGLRFPNPVGLAAGYDKDAVGGPALAALGFGFLEFGTLTARPQPGNPRPRLFRFPEREAVVNRMGFNNEGAEAAAARLARFRARPEGRRVPVGANIGINKDVPAERAHEEYARAFSLLAPHADYFTLNVSSPNTEGLRRLQERLRLERILTALKSVNPQGKPVFVKLAPDLEPGELEELLPLLVGESAGVVCTNTTLSREGLPEGLASTRGGLSGAPLRERATAMIREVRRRTGGRLPIIGSGGILEPEDAWQKLRAGASLVQVYTGLVFRGPDLAREIKRGLLRLMREQGLERVRDAVGRSHPMAETPR
ncbi:MAG: quinone-dependent dihydroorotate dehydrogenase [Elusimicrobiota bacterium]|jgi:dihydroorotate dehydrogenase